MASHFIDGEWVEGVGDVFSAENPTTGEIAWAGRSATAADVHCGIDAARRALRSWSGSSLSARVEHMHAFAEKVKEAKPHLVDAICVSTGKPRWEAVTEVDAMVNKVAISIDTETKRAGGTASEASGVRSATRYKPHGVCAVIGPFNFPGHLPNGHIVPALLAGNTIVYKPSELTPLVAALYTSLLIEAGIPRGVFNLLQGQGDVGRRLCEHEEIDGIFFTGSRHVGLQIAQANVERTGRILALEMGGNNPLVVHRVADVQAAAYTIIQSAYITAGQRCSCARRLILVQSDAKQVLGALMRMTECISVGPFTMKEEPFIGPVITTTAAARALEAQQMLMESGGKPLVQMKSLGPRENFLMPGIIDTTNILRAERNDREVFAPLLEVIRVESFDEAIVEANATLFGLAAGLLSDERSLWEQFFGAIRAGVVNWNRPTTGASSALPFGGIGDSGNHRPSASAAAEYCSYPVAVMESDRVSMPSKVLPGIRVE